MEEYFSSHVKHKPFSLRSCILAGEIFFSGGNGFEGGVGNKGGKVLGVEDKGREVVLEKGLKEEGGKDETRFLDLEGREVVLKAILSSNNQARATARSKEVGDRAMTSR